MNSVFIKRRPLYAIVRACWVRKDNYRVSYNRSTCTDAPTLFTLVIEQINVESPHRRQGHARRFIEEAIAEPGYELVIVECVQNPHLADALMRWGWSHDPVVMDFYWRRKTLPENPGKKQNPGKRTKTPVFSSLGKSAQIDRYPIAPVPPSLPSSPDHGRW